MFQVHVTKITRLVLRGPYSKDTNDHRTPTFYFCHLGRLFSVWLQLSVVTSIFYTAKTSGVYEDRTRQVTMIIPFIHTHFDWTNQCVDLKRLYNSHEIKRPMLRLIVELIGSSVLQLYWLFISLLPGHNNLLKSFMIS